MNYLNAEVERELTKEAFECYVADCLWALVGNENLPHLYDLLHMGEVEELNPVEISDAFMEKFKKEFE